MPAKQSDKGNERFKVLESILNNLNVAILVSDMVTNKILYANEKMLAMYPNTPLVNRICWEVLKSETKRCKDCPIPRLLKKPGDSYQHEKQEEDGYFQIYDSIIPWAGGKMAHLRYVVEITR